jgi:hypothetical protein
MLTYARTRVRIAICVDEGELTLAFLQALARVAVQSQRCKCMRVHAYVFAYAG